MKNAGSQVESAFFCGGMDHPVSSYVFFPFGRDFARLTPFQRMGILKFRKGLEWSRES